MPEPTTFPPGSIAITGMSGRFPGAENLPQFWRNLLDGVESVSRFGPDEMEYAADVSEGLQTMAARGVLDGADRFDAAFFNILPEEAARMDPQHRVFLEECWHALECAGCDPERFPGLIGVFAGLSMNTYLLAQIIGNRTRGRELAAAYQLADYHTILGNDKDFLPTRVSYKLNLRGPSVAVQSACSTSLVAVNEAVQSLLTYQCDAALAGGVSITFPQKRGYVVEEGGMASADGHTRTFDAGACGTVFGHGTGVVLLRRLEDALAAGEPVLAVIRGVAINNDGSEKVGFAAPGVNGQARVIAMAQEIAQVEPESISYIEAHGTGTPLGDPIEIAALKQAFGTQRRGFCAIGSVKPNIGHLDCAAGVAGLIKTVLCLQHEKLPRLLHFTKPNPRIDFGPFEPLSEVRDWPRGDQPRRAGVSAFGVGGTNVHLVLEEAPVRSGEGAGAAEGEVLLPFSARSETALKMMAENLAQWVREHPELPMRDVAHTLQCGRRRFEHRSFVVCGDRERWGELAEVVHSKADAARVAFLFPGQGAQRAGLGRGVADATFREVVEECQAVLGERMDVHDLIFGDSDVAVDDTRMAQPLLFTVELALARMWMARGVYPELLIGHSVGEYVAAHLAGVMTLRDALELVWLRGSLMQELPAGAMFSVRAAPGMLEDWLPQELSIAAFNGPNLCVVSGPEEVAQAFALEADKRGLATKRLKTSHAFHSAMMEPMLETFRAAVEKVERRAPQIKWVSTLTGQLVRLEDMADASYWTRQIRMPVAFGPAISCAVATGFDVGLESGPGRALSIAALQNTDIGERPLIASLPGGAEAGGSSILRAQGMLWQHGASPQWEGGCKVALPGYPFERQRFWIDEGEMAAAQSVPPMALPEAVEPLVASQDRMERLVGELRDLTGRLSGVNMTAIDPATTFTQLGFDSLFLTQASQAVQKKYGVRVTFRELLGGLGSLQALAEHLDKSLPVEERVAPAAPRQDQAPAGSLEAVIAQQSRVLQQILDSQRGGASADALPVIRAPESLLRNPGKQRTRFGPYKPPEKSVHGGYAPGQQAALDALIARYVARTARSKAYTAEHRPHFADPRAVSGFHRAWKEMVYPIVCKGSSGAKLWDIDGNEWIDFTNGFGSIFFGHSPDFIKAAVREQIERGVEIGPQSEVAGEVAELMCEFTRMERVTFCNTGSEAVMAALRLARTVTGREQVVFFAGGYHGTFDEVLARGTWEGGMYAPAAIAPGIPESLIRNMVVLEYGRAESLEIVRAHAHEFAAVLVEPVQSRQPGLQPREFLQELRTITEASGTALIFDEVVTGFRCHPGGAQAHFSVRADMATYGKVVGGGYPIGVLAGRREYMDALDGGAWAYGDESFPEVGVTFFAGTFVRHPVAMAAARAVLRKLKEEGPALQLRLNERATRMTTVLNEQFEACGAPLRFAQFSSVALLEYPEDVKTGSLFWYALRSRGVHAWEGRPFFFTLAHGDAEMDALLQAARDSLEELQAGDLLPGSVAQSRRAFPRHDRSPMTEAQKEIFYSAVVSDEANCAYNESGVLELTGPLHAGALRDAAQLIVQRHAALRSRFAEDGSMQIYQDEAVLDWLEMEGDVREVAALEMSAPFQLFCGPLIRFRLVREKQENHSLIITAHHLVSDGWSSGMIVDELSRVYNAKVRGEIPLLAPPRSFAEYAREEAVKSRAESLEYWRGELGSGVVALELPLDYERPQVKTYAGAVEHLRIEGAMFDSLLAAAPGLGGTLFSTLFAAVNVLLHRLTGQRDLVVGVPAAGQVNAGVDELIGHCLTFLPIRLRLDTTKSLREIAQAAQTVVLRAYEHQDTTYGTLVRELKLPRDPSRLPLTSVMFNIDKNGIDRLEFDGLKFAYRVNPKRFVNFELFFNLVQTRQAIDIECEYNTDLFKPETVRGWLKEFCAVMADMVERSDENFSDAPPATSWAVHELVAEMAKQKPDAVAVECGEERLTYVMLERKACGLAARLQARGVKSGDLVGVYLERGVDLPAGLLGVLKTGAAYVPLDPAFPEARLRMMMEDAGVCVVVSNVPGAPAGVDWVDVNGADGEEGELQQVEAGRTAYVIYTSGSTGRPKGVSVPHRALTNFICSMQAEPGFAESDALLAVTTLSFDISGLEMFLPIVSGGRLIVARRDEVVDGAALLRLIDKHGVNVMQATPATWRLLLEAGWKGGLKVLCGGEAFPRELANTLAERCEQVWNMYGPTETTIWSTISRVSVGEGPVPIGRPIANTTVCVVDENLAPVAPGTTGELLIGGVGVADGYSNRPELTAERFIPDFLSRVPGAKLYRTGDLARWRADGELECLGRMDQQIKLRGHRIEPGEIEALLERHPSVKQSAVVLRAGTGGRDQLVAYVVAQGDDTAGWRGQWDALFTSAIAESNGALERIDTVISAWALGKEGEGQVEEWMGNTLRRVEALRPRRVLEIGCGTGQLLLRLAPHCERYVGTDFSLPAVEKLQAHVAAVPELRDRVRVEHAAADDLSAVDEESFDLVLIHSVAQYFPDAAYLERVLAGCWSKLTTDGCLYLGDMQSCRLLECHHVVNRLPHMAADATVEDLRTAVRERMKRENELVADPAWVRRIATGLENCSAVEIQLRRGKADNEITRFHYDALLHGRDAASMQIVEEWHPLHDALDPMRVIEMTLRTAPEELAAFRGIPNARLLRPLALWQAVMNAQPEKAVAVLAANLPEADEGVEPEDLYGLAERLGFTLHLRWAGDGGTMDAVFVPKSMPRCVPLFPDAKEQGEVNSPFRVQGDRSALAKQLREHLAVHLADYMIPSMFVCLDELPLTPNGKIDRKALPTAEVVADAKTFAAPRNDMERQLAEIWADVLGLERVGVDDAFFELGGDSILSFQITARATQAGIALSPRHFFEHRTIAEMAKAVGDGAAQSPPGAGAIRRVSREQYRKDKLQP